MRLALLLAGLISFAPAGAWAQQSPETPDATDADSSPKAESTDSKAVPLDEIRRFVTVFNSIRQAYVTPKSDTELMHSAVRGLLFDLDPHSVYFDRDDAERFDSSTEGQYEGLGVEVQQQPGPMLKIIAPMDGGPAARAGLKSGDLIIAVDGKPVGTDNGNRALRGKAGSTVKLTIRRGKEKPFDVSVTREKIIVPSVAKRMLEPGFGLVRVSGFQATTAKEFDEALQSLNTSSGGKLRGLVIDLRSNPGGLLNAAVEMADDLMNAGNIVSTRGRVKSGDTIYTAHAGDVLQGAPVVVLVDAGSASASEVLAAALQDSGRARVVGSLTFGKGSVQSLLPLDNGDAVKLTTARYYTPKNRSIQGVGIVPDVLVKADGKTRNVTVNEASLLGHLRGEEEMSGETGGEVLSGEMPVNAALSELKRMAGVAPVAKPKPKAK
ncbi:S41 family peptidase [Lysobacter soyae]|uniref:S41 family peptidase n=1 Tax=Lysobacter soyae TaxID=2764185 RepID=A0ABX8WQU0_9GAMM|nr:S41 family peptidase [Lysobacter sp. CJ11]QYR53201.1 S41 family peptidase [Lysobacter sp. CJ11]